MRDVCETDGLLMFVQSLKLVFWRSVMIGRVCVLIDVLALLCSAYFVTFVVALLGVRGWFCLCWGWCYLFGRRGRRFLGWGWV